MARGDHIQTWVNGVKVSDLHDKNQLKGYFGIQHHGKGGIVKFRKVRARALAKETSNAQKTSGSEPSPKA